MGVGGQAGWAAIDEFTLTREGEGCQILPKSANPATPEPTIGSTVPPDEDFGCTFQEDFCNFGIRGDEGFVFKRMNGSGVPTIGADHNFDESAVFLFASSEAIEDSLQVGKLIGHKSLFPLRYSPKSVLPLWKDLRQPFSVSISGFIWTAFWTEQRMSLWLWHR